MRGKMLISVIILAVFVVGAGILLFSSSADPDDQETTDGGFVMDIEDGNEQLINPNTPLPTPTEPIETPPPPPPDIASVVFTFQGNRRDEFSVRVGENVGIGIRVEPPGVDLTGFTVEWASSNESVFQVVPQFVTEGLAVHTGGSVTGMGAGSGRLSVVITDPDGEVVYEHSIPVHGRS